MFIIASMYMGSLVTSLFVQRFSKNTDTLMYSTITGEIGALSPIDNAKKVEALLELESHMISDASLVCRVVDDYRSYYLPSIVRDRINYEYIGSD